VTADGDLDDHVPPERDDAASNEPNDVTDERPSPEAGSSDDAPADEPPAEAPSPPAEPRSIPVLRNLRAFDRRSDELDDTGPVDITPARTAPAENGSASPDTAAPGAGAVPSADAAATDPTPGDPTGADPVPAGPTRTDPASTDPLHTDRSDAHPVQDDPIVGDAPTIAGPVTDPIPAEAPTAAAPVPPPPARPADGRTELALEQGAEEPEEKKRSPLRSLIEWAVVIIGALVVATVIKTFLFQAFWIPSDSMLPTLQQQDRVLVNKLSYDLHDVNRGDVVVFERPPGETEKIKDLIKRVIAVEGDTLTLQDGKVLVNGKAVDEPYLPEGAETVNICAFTGTVKVPDGHVFVMGDNRGNSKDSRCFGPIDEDLIVGRAFVRVWPLNALGTL
jgi:signal peptidase I